MAAKRPPACGYRTSVARQRRDQRWVTRFGGAAGKPAVSGRPVAPAIRIEVRSRPLQAVIDVHHLFEHSVHDAAIGNAGRQAIDRRHAAFDIRRVADIGHRLAQVRRRTARRRPAARAERGAEVDRRRIEQTGQRQPLVAHLVHHLVDVEHSEPKANGPSGRPSMCNSGIDFDAFVDGGHGVEDLFVAWR